MTIKELTKEEVNKAILSLEKKINTTQTKETPASNNPALAKNKMDKIDPQGSGSFSLNRKENTTVGNYSTAEGYNSQAKSQASHAEGFETIAGGKSSHAEGTKTIANSDNMHAAGKFNKTTSGVARVTGWGTAENRKDIETLDTSGNLKVAGKIYSDGKEVLLKGGIDGVLLKSDVDNTLDNTSSNPIANKAIASLIPSSATSENQLADKNFVNSSIATETAYFKGTFNSVEELPTTDVTNNDYAFIKVMDETTGLVKQYDRYKYVSSSQSWIYEYTLNNSSFTSDQWNAINSGITDTLVNRLNGIEPGAQKNVQSDWNQTDTTADDYIKNKPTSLPANGGTSDYLSIKTTTEPDSVNISGVYCNKISNYDIGWISKDGMIITIPWSSTYAFQIAVDDQSNWIAVRSMSNGTWNGWEKLAKTGDVPTVQNNLTSSSTTDALSAAQGKALNENKLDKSSNGFSFKNEDMSETAENLSGTTTAHTSTFYRNGISIPYQMDNSNDGGIIRCRGTTENSTIFEMGTWDDSGAGETIQFNYYPTTSRSTPTYSVEVPKKSGTIALTTDIPTSLPANGGTSSYVTNGVAHSISADIGINTNKSFISMINCNPDGGTYRWWHIITDTWSNAADSWKAQIAFPTYHSAQNGDSGKTIWIRYETSAGVWGSWIRMATYYESTHVPTTAQTGAGAIWVS